MKKITMLMFVLAFAVIATAGETKKCDSVGKAEDLWNYNLKSEALACLDEVIMADPTNTKAHFLKGKLCLVMDNYVCAKERFTASPVRAEHGGEIAALYKGIGDVWLNANNLDKAEEFYREASIYKLSVGREVASQLFAKGKQNNNNAVILLAARLDPSLKQAISDYYHSLSKNAPRKEDQVDLLGKAAEYDNTKMVEYTENKEALGRFHLEEVKKWARIPGKEKVTDDHRQAARKYLGEAVVEAELPEVKKFSKGEYDLGEFKAGEQTPYMITVSERSEIRFKATSKNIKQVFEDGREFCFWKEQDREKLNNMETNSLAFKLIATDAVGITLVVK